MNPTSYIDCLQIGLGTWRLAIGRSRTRHAALTNPRLVTRVGSPRVPLRRALLLVYDEAAGDLIVERLLLFGKTDHQISDEQHQGRQNLAEVPPGGPRKRDRLALQVGDFHVRQALSGSGLVPGRLEPCRIDLCVQRP